MARSLGTNQVCLSGLSVISINSIILHWKVVQIFTFTKNAESFVKNQVLNKHWCNCVSIKCFGVKALKQKREVISSQSRSSRASPPTNESGLEWKLSAQSNANRSQGLKAFKPVLTLILMQRWTRNACKRTALQCLRWSKNLQNDSIPMSSLRATHRSGTEHVLGVGITSELVAVSQSNGSKQHVLRCRVAFLTIPHYIAAFPQYSCGAAVEQRLPVMSALTHYHYLRSQWFQSCRSLLIIALIAILITLSVNSVLFAISETNSDKRSNNELNWRTQRSNRSNRSNTSLIISYLNLFSLQSHHSLSTSRRKISTDSRRQSVFYSKLQWLAINS